MSASSSPASLRHAHFGVAHRRRRIAVDRAEIALAVDQQVAHRERLRHAHDRVVDRGIAVRVILADHVADHARALLVRPCSSRCRARASRTARADAPASGRRAHRAARARRSRSWRNRGTTCASRLRDLRAIFRVRSRPFARVRMSLRAYLSGFKGGESRSQHRLILAQIAPVLSLASRISRYTCGMPAVPADTNIKARWIVPMTRRDASSSITPW